MNQTDPTPTVSTEFIVTAPVVDVFIEPGVIGRTSSLFQIVAGFIGGVSINMPTGSTGDQPCYGVMFERVCVGTFTAGSAQEAVLIGLEKVRDLLALVGDGSAIEKETQGC